MGRRWSFLLVLGLAVLVGAVALFVRGSSSGDVSASMVLPAAGGAKAEAPVTLRVQAPDQAGDVSIEPLTELPEVPGIKAVGMSGIRLLAAPAHVTPAQSWSGTATISFDYHDRVLPQAPPGADPAPYGAGSLVVLTRESSEDADARWSPVEAVVDAQAQTISVSTPHFSSWAVGVLDPEVLIAQRAEQDRVNSGDGSIERILYGEKTALSCSPDHLLLAVLTRTEPGVKLDACQEVLDDGSYRLSLVNRAGLPRRITVPPGFRVEGAPGGLQAGGDPKGTFTSTDMDSLTVALFSKAFSPAGTTTIGPGYETALTFDAAAVQPGLSLDVAQDDLHAVWSLFGKLLKVAVGDSDPEAVQQLVLLMKEVDCLGKLSVELAERAGDASAQRRAELGAALLDQCGKDIAGVMLQIAKENVAGSPRQVWRGITTRLTMLLNVEDWMAVARDELNLGFQIGGEGSAYYQDVSGEVRPTRVMSSEEAFALPLVSRSAEFPEDSSDDATCATLGPTDFPPAGAPAFLPASVRGDPELREVTCVRALELDLDGNGRPDRLLTWAAGGTVRPGTTSSGDPEPAQPLTAAQVRAVHEAGGTVGRQSAWSRVPDPTGPFYGMVAYLDDGTWHLLEDDDAVGTWEVHAGFGPEDVHYLSPAAAVPSAGGGQAALVGYVQGANTSHAVLVGLSADGRLRVARTSDGAVAGIYAGGGVTDRLAYGCVTVDDPALPPRLRSQVLLAQTSAQAPGTPTTMEAVTVVSELTTPPRFAEDRAGPLLLSPVGRHRVTLPVEAPTWPFGGGRGCLGEPGRVSAPVEPA